MKKYIKVECPVCGKISQGSSAGNVQQGCQHFERIDENDNVVIFINDFGEEVPVDLETVGDRCISFECPICREQLDACTKGNAREYRITGKCSHFIELLENGKDRFKASFREPGGDVREVDVF